MELTFDYYNNAQDATIYLCNPDKSLLGALYAKNKNVTLRFNNISDLNFEVPKYVSNSEGETIVHPYYDRIATKRLLKVDGIGWFRITQAVETENSTGAIKSVTAESHQCVFKDMGFVEENRLYKLYDEDDVYDENYDSNDESAIPSVVGQLYQQLGITCNVDIGDITPDEDYGEWKIIWIEESLRFDANKEENLCRTLKGNEALFGYDFMVNDVENAFQVVFEFDFLHHAIKIKSAESVAAKTNIYLSFENLIQEMSVTEKSDEIVTVLSCKGDGLDISSVNPTGTNYICDFSYFMGSAAKGYPWMSAALTNRVEQWKRIVESKKEEYAAYVEQLEKLYLEKTALESRKTYVDLKLKDTETARDQYIDNETTRTSTFCAEELEGGDNSIETASYFCENKFPICVKTIDEMAQILSDAKNNGYYFCYTGEGAYGYEKNAVYKVCDNEDDGLVFSKYSKLWTCYKNPPMYKETKNEETGEIFCGYEFDENAEFIVGNGLQNCYDPENNGYSTYKYFIDEDVDYPQSYCIIKEGTYVDGENAVFYAEGFKRMAPNVNSGYWCDLHTAEERDIEKQIKAIVGDEATENTIEWVLAQMRAITNETNILKYFSKYPHLLKELKCYWVDGQYTNENLSALEGTTVAENLQLAKELMAAGELELRRVCQPRFSFTVTAANFLKMPQFINFAKELALGRVVTVEKNENTHYFPSLTEMSFSLDTSDNFSLTFSNSLKLTDWGYTYADLIKSASNTTRTVEANWSNLIEYSQNKQEISNMLYHTLDRTLRAGMDNAYDQDFVIDDTGILGRKKKGDGTFEDYQVRMMNNLLVFTDDNWKTSRLALGKIKYEGENENIVTAYGLIADAIIGDLILGKKMRIANEDSTISLDKDGIIIKKPTETITNEDGTETIIEPIVFKADKDGNLHLEGTVIANKGNIGGLEIDESGTLSTSDFKINNTPNEDGKFYTVLEWYKEDGDTKQVVASIDENTIDIQEGKFKTMSSSSAQISSLAIGATEDSEGSRITFGNELETIELVFSPGGKEQKPISFMAKATGSAKLGRASKRVTVRLGVMAGEGGSAKMVDYYTNEKFTIGVVCHAKLDNEKKRGTIIINPGEHEGSYNPGFSWGINENYYIASINGKDISGSTLKTYESDILGYVYKDMDIKAIRKKNGVIASEISLFGEQQANET